VTDLAQLRRETFALSHNLHWTYSDVMALDVVERRAYVVLVAEFIQEQNDAVERARRGDRP
jgi:hypothetical protein